MDIELTARGAVRVLLPSAALVALVVYAFAVPESREDPTLAALGLVAIWWWLGALAWPLLREERRPR
jgi:hypothetical protein